MVGMSIDSIQSRLALSGLGTTLTISRVTPSDLKRSWDREFESRPPDQRVLRGASCKALGRFEQKGCWM
jgi:hypothetical protein